MSGNPGASRSAARRWLVVGSGGAGKSTLARALAHRLNLPLVHLDRHYWGPAWAPTPPAAWEARVRELAAAEAWVMDGNYGGTVSLRLERAERVVFLDFGRLRCLWRIAKRRWATRRSPRPDLPEGVADQLTWEFVRWVWRYPEEGRRRMTAKLAAAPHVPVDVLRTPGEVRRFLAGLAEARAVQAPGGDGR